MPSITGDYKLKASSPSDDPSTSAIEVQPGQELTVDAIATVTYNGISIVTPPIVITTDLRLLKGTDEKASATQSITLDPMVMESGNTYTKSGSGTLTVPSGTGPGTYKLNCHAIAEASILGQSKSKTAAKSFTVQVIQSPQPAQNYGQSTGASTEKPVNVTVKRLLRGR